MGLIAVGGGSSNFKPVPDGIHLARCYSIVDLGHQKSDYKGKINNLHKILIQFEVHGEDDEGNPLHTEKGEPMSISKTFTNSIKDNANLRRDLESWRGKQFTEEELLGFTLKNVLGVWGMISVMKTKGSNDKFYTVINSITPVPKQMKANLPEGYNDLRLFDLDDFRQEDFDKLSNYYKEKIKLSDEYKKLNLSDPVVKAGSFADMESDIPF
jgi:hypothetical protein